MLTWNEARIVITDRFLAGWGNHLPYFIEGQEQPDMSQQSAAFATVRIEPTTIRQSAMLGQNPPRRAYGLLDITIFVPESAGAKVRLDALDKVVNTFTAAAVGDVVFQNMNVLSVVDGKGWRSQTTLSSFYFAHKKE